jgi:hypothetical protein
MAYSYNQRNCQLMSGFKSLFRDWIDKTFHTSGPTDSNNLMEKLHARLKIPPYQKKFLTNKSLKSLWASNRQKKATHKNCYEKISAKISPGIFFSENYLEAALKY